MLDRLPELYRAVWISILLVLVAVIMSFWSPIPSGDTAVYYGYAEKMWHGALPYRDFPIEYPPGVLPFILLAKPLGVWIGKYTLGFISLSGVAVAISLWHRSTQNDRLWPALLMLPLLSFIFPLLDVYAALALYGSLFALKKQRWHLSAVLLAFSVLIKAYPIVCLPALCLATPRQHRRKFLLTFILVVGIGLLPFLLISSSGVWHAVTYHSGRPIDFLSGPAAVGYIMHLLGEPLKLVGSHVSVALSFRHEPLINMWSSILVVSSLVTAFWLLKAKVRFYPVLTSIALLLVYIIFFKVGSPQFVVPILFLIPLAQDELPPRSFRRLQQWFLAVGLATFVLLMFGVSRLFEAANQSLENINVLSELLAILRIVILAAFLVWVVRQLRRPKAT